MLGPVAVGTLAALAAAQFDWRLVVPVAIGLPLATVVVRGDAVVRLGMQPSSTPARWVSALHHPKWLARVWAAMYLFSTIRVIEGQRSVHAAASGVASLDIALELVAVAAAGCTVMSALYRGMSGRTTWLVRLLLAFAVLCVSSVMWSQLPLFSMVRAGEIMVLAMFTAYCARRAEEEPGFADEMIVVLLRTIVFATLALAAWGIAEGGLARSRFGWRGDHPNTVCVVLLVPVVALLAEEQRVRITRPLPWWGVVGFLVPLGLATGARAVVAATVVAIVACWLVRALKDGQIGVVGLGVALIVGGFAAQFASDQILDFVLRDQDAGTVRRLNGRLDLWHWVLENPVGSEVHGVGVGAVRGGLPESWAGNAHSGWIELLQTLGVLGLATMGAVVVATAGLVVVRRSHRAAWMLVFALVVSLNSQVLSIPNWGLVLVCVAIVALANPESTTDPPRPSDAPPAPGRRPALRR